jgi:hypothetical protein
MNTQVATTTVDYTSAIERAAADKNFDLDKFERLCALQEAAQIRTADQAFGAALSAAEAEMQTISTDASNPQTRSRYATFAQVDGAVRPIYTKHGFAISFTSEKTGTPGSILVVGTLSHRLGGSRRYEVPMPITTTGFRGQANMTETHATMAAISYGRRNLEIMMFNLAIGDDTDGNAPRQPPAASTHNPNALKPNQYIHPETGEVIILEGEHLTPGMIEWLEKDTWPTWVPRFMAHLKTSATLDEIQQWVDLNTSRLDLLTREKPATAVGVNAAIDAFRKRFA